MLDRCYRRARLRALITKTSEITSVKFSELIPTAETGVTRLYSIYNSTEILPERREQRLSQFVILLLPLLSATVIFIKIKLLRLGPTFKTKVVQPLPHAEQG